MEFVNFLKNPQQYHELGARIPKVGVPTWYQTLNLCLFRGIIKHKYVQNILESLVLNNVRLD
jgi:Fe2+ or Zn2+ uptake regulation protein